MPLPTSSAIIPTFLLSSSLNALVFLDFPPALSTKYWFLPSVLPPMSFEWTVAPEDLPQFKPVCYFIQLIFLFHWSDSTPFNWILFRYSCFFIKFNLTILINFWFLWCTFLFPFWFFLPIGRYFNFCWWYPFPFPWVYLLIYPPSDVLNSWIPVLPWVPWLFFWAALWVLPLPVWFY